MQNLFRAMPDELKSPNFLGRQCPQYITANYVKFSQFVKKVAGGVKLIGILAYDLWRIWLNRKNLAELMAST